MINLNTEGDMYIINNTYLVFNYYRQNLINRIQTRPETHPNLFRKANYFFVLHLNPLVTVLSL